LPSLELFVPDLVPLLLASNDLSKTCPALHRWLARARATRSACGSAQQALCERFGVARQRDWPVAPLTLAADGGVPEDAHWLRADPAHLQAGRGDLILARTHGLALDRAEAEALIASLNAHFAADGLRFAAPAVQRWYLRTEAAPALVTTPAPAALGRNVDPLLPRGEDALHWHWRLNEIQMLLHEHPVNQAREARGAAPVNSIWLWGGGRMPECHLHDCLAVWSDSALARGLARCAGSAGHGLPVDAETWLHALPDGSHLVAFDEELEPLESGPAGRLARLEREWFAPLLAALRAGALNELVLSTHHLAHQVRFAASRLDLRKFWRRAVPLASLATDAAAPA
jgi:hypothetical protein